MDSAVRQRTTDERKNKSVAGENISLDNRRPNAESFYLFYGIIYVEKFTMAIKRPIDGSTLTTFDFIATLADVERVSYLAQITYFM